jgi:hypothetical protein
MKKLVYLFVFIVVYLFHVNNAGAFTKNEEDCTLNSPNNYFNIPTFIDKDIVENIEVYEDNSEVSFEGECINGSFGKGVLRSNKNEYYIEIKGNIYKGWFIDKIEIQVSKNPFGDTSRILVYDEVFYVYKDAVFDKSNEFLYYVQHNLDSNDTGYDEWKNEIYEQKKLVEQKKLAEAKRLSDEQESIEVKRLSDEQESIEAKRKSDEQESAEELRLADEHELAEKKRLADLKYSSYNSFKNKKREKNCHVNFSEDFVFDDFTTSDIKNKGSYNWDGECVKGKANGIGELTIYAGSIENSVEFKCEIKKGEFVKKIEFNFSGLIDGVKLIAKGLMYIFIVCLVIYVILKVKSYVCEEMRKQEALARYKAKAEQERQAKIKAEQERQARAKAEQEKQAREKAEQEKQAREKAEQERKDKAKAEEVRLANVKAEQERQANAKAEQEIQANLKKVNDEKLYQDSLSKLVELRKNHPGDRTFIFNDMDD